MFNKNLKKINDIKDVKIICIIIMPKKLLIGKEVIFK